MPFHTPSTISLRCTSAETVGDALRLLFSHLELDKAAGYVELLAEGFRSGETPWDSLLEARRGKQLVGTALVQVQPGHTAVVWPPRLVAGEPTSTAERLLTVATEKLEREGVHVAHALLDRVEAADEAVLRKGGYEALATLLYLVSLEIEFPHAPPQGPLEFEPYGEDNHDRLAAMVQATYESSLDCPALDGLRGIEDVLAGYRATGDFSPQRWFILCHAGTDVGCLILTDHARDENWELIYIGLVASARGSGWGKQAVRYAQWLTRQARRPRLVSAVDASNRPALEMYASTGFQAWDRRYVYVRTFPKNRREDS